jgi:hypothetical protein
MKILGKMKSLSGETEGNKENLSIVSAIIASEYNLRSVGFFYFIFVILPPPRSCFMCCFLKMRHSLTVCAQERPAKTTNRRLHDSSTVLQTQEV